MLRVRKRRLKKYRHCGDADGSNVKWRPIVTESILDTVGEISTDSAEHLAVSQTSGNLMDYEFLFLFGIKTEMDDQNLCTVCGMFKLNYMIRIYGRQELHEQDYIDWTKWSHLPNNDKFACLFIDKLPDTLAHRVQFILKLFTIILQEQKESTSIFRFNKTGDIFKMSTEGHVIKSWYNGYFGQYTEERKSYDDTLFTAQFATLANTSNHTIYNECDAELRKIRDRILAKKSAKRLDESVLDDLECSDIESKNILAKAKLPALDYDEMYLFNAVPKETDSAKPLVLVKDLAVAMGIDMCVELWHTDEMSNLDYIDSTYDEYFQTDFQVCVYIRRPKSDYLKAKFFLMLMQIISNGYETGTDIYVYINKHGDFFKARTWQGGTMLKLNMAINQEKLNAKNN